MIKITVYFERVESFLASFSCLLRSSLCVCSIQQYNTRTIMYVCVMTKNWNNSDIKTPKINWIRLKNKIIYFFFFWEINPWGSLITDKSINLKEEILITYYQNHNKNEQKKNNNFYDIDELELKFWGARHRKTNNQAMLQTIVALIK